MDSLGRGYRGPPWAQVVKMIDKKITDFQNKDLQEHLTLLRSWNSTLNDVERWYQTNQQEFVKTVDQMRLQYEMTQDAVVFHDHTYSLPACRSSKLFVPHECGRMCGRDSKEPSDSPPLAQPLLSGWESYDVHRVILKTWGDSSRFDVYYVAPCGRKLRSMDEVMYFLNLIGDVNLTGINFTFDALCSVKPDPYDPQLDKALVCADISGGKEAIPVSCVNEFSDALPHQIQERNFKYLTKMTFEPDITHKTGSDEFLVCCSCKDHCANRSKCECWQLTQQEAKVIGTQRYSVGYVHHRLRRQQHSAVYECNSRCGCGQQCPNRVVQGGLRHRLQVFYTGDPDLQWGLRSLEDIPLGTFVCTYIGHVYTEIEAEKKASHHGDEYYADLDYIEVMEYHKQGYESEAPPLDSSSSPTSEVRSLSSNSGSLLTTPTPRTSPEGNSNHSDESSPETSPLLTTHPQQAVTPSPSPDINPSPTTQLSLLAGPTSGSPHPHHSPSPYRSLRHYYNENFNYIMDAKSQGNLGRFINHSCDPNLFVQNVFVDTQDLRFPMVTFFARRLIKAKEELTWDYNYEIGSVENKIILCKCRAENCKKRLL